MHQEEDKEIEEHALGDEAVETLGDDGFINEDEVIEDIEDEEDFYFGLFNEEEEDTY